MGVKIGGVPEMAIKVITSEATPAKAVATQSSGTEKGLSELTKLVQSAGDVTTQAAFLSTRAQNRANPLRDPDQAGKVVKDVVERVKDTAKEDLVQVHGNLLTDAAITSRP